MEAAPSMASSGLEMGLARGIVQIPGRPARPGRSCPAGRSARAGLLLSPLRALQHQEATPCLAQASNIVTGGADRSSRFRIRNSPSETNATFKNQSLVVFKSAEPGGEMGVFQGRRLEVRNTIAVFFPAFVLLTRFPGRLPKSTDTTSLRERSAKRK